jgi:release factor glutamine methyltransferase
VSQEFSPEAAHAHGRQRFLGLDFLVAPGVLVPRQETELLARAAIEALTPGAGRGGPSRVVDLCCGSGNLACAIAWQLPSLQVWACDLLPAAAELTRRNVEALGLNGRVTVLRGDLLAPLIGLGLEHSLDALVCNPPYISTGRLEGDRASLLTHEPREAFDGGPYGLAIHQRVAREAGPFLRPGAPLLMEIGMGQDRQVVRLLERAGGWNAIDLRRDANGVPRVVVAYRASIPGGT